tara:strand:- start:150 stop:341 length:192 start_codon:yes stop_codon:yes gene_type:complete
LKQHVKELKQLQNFKVKFEDSVEEILDSPREWAERVAEEQIILHINKYEKAKKLGKQFAKKLK